MAGLCGVMPCASSNTLVRFVCLLCARPAVQQRQVRGEAAALMAWMHVVERMSAFALSQTSCCLCRVAATLGCSCACHAVRSLQQRTSNTSKAQCSMAGMQDTHLHKHIYAVLHASLGSFRPRHCWCLVPPTAAYTVWLSRRQQCAAGLPRRGSRLIPSIRLESPTPKNGATLFRLFTYVSPLLFLVLSTLQASAVCCRSAATWLAQTLPCCGAGLHARRGRGSCGRR